MPIFQPVRQHVDHRLRFRLRVFLIIWLVLALVIAIDVLRHKFDISLVLLGSLTGFLIGLVLSRMYRLDWEQETTKVVSQLDVVGRVILGVYILFMVGRDWILGFWIQASDLMAFILCFTAGTMIGRVAGTRRGIRRILQALGVAKLEKPGSSQM